MSGNGHRRVLLAAHVVAAVAVCGFCNATRGRIPGLALEQIPAVVAVALVLAQACLLGLWAGFGGASGPIRLAGLGVGVVASTVALAVATRGDGREFLLLPLFCAALIAPVAAVLRLRGVEPRLDPGPSAAAGREGLRFSIRGLMIFTALVAVPIGGARSLRASLGSRGPSLFLIAVWSVCFVVVALAAAWAALGRERPPARVAAVLLVATALGALFAYGIGEDGLESFACFLICSVLQSVIVLATLLVLRRAGYRLAGRDPAGAAGPPPEDEPVAAAWSAEV